MSNTSALENVRLIATGSGVWTLTDSHLEALNEVLGLFDEVVKTLRQTTNELEKVWAGRGMVNPNAYVERAQAVLTKVEEHP